MNNVTQLIKPTPVNAGDELWSLAVRASASAGLGGANPYLDKLTVTMNGNIEDTFNLSNNFKVERDPKTGGYRVGGSVALSKPARRVKVGGKIIRLPAVSGGLSLKNGKPVLRVPLIGYDYTLGDTFDMQKALKGAKVFARNLVKSNYSLIQDAVFPKKLDVWLDRFVADLSPEQRRVVGPFAKQLLRHGKNALKIIVTELVLGDQTQARKMLDRELKSLQKDFDGFVKRAGDTALREFGSALGVKISTQQTRQGSRAITLTVAGKKEAWEVGVQFAQAVTGVPLPTADAQLVALNETLQDPFNVANNLPADQSEIQVPVDAATEQELQNEVASRMDAEQDTEAEDPESASELSFSLDD